MSPRKRHPKKPKLSFVETNKTSSSAGGFLRRAYKSFLEYLTFSDEINALECTPEGLAKLEESALGLREELNHALRDELERHRSIAETIDLENLGSRPEPLNWEPLLRYVDQELLRHYWFSMVLHPIPPSDWRLPRDELTKKHGDKLDALKKKLDGELRGFANLVNDKKIEGGRIVYEEANDAWFDFKLEFKRNDLFSKKQQFYGQCAIELKGQDTIYIAENIDWTDQPWHIYVRQK